tara:strand:- start:417 stop:548 length:132 start_codon:yes stop_codon:yes gene_type:complete
MKIEIINLNKEKNVALPKKIEIDLLLNEVKQLKLDSSDQTRMI